jgi:hypothetical protein
MITGAPPNISDTILINGQPGDFLPCSSQGTYVCSPFRFCLFFLLITLVVEKFPDFLD